MSTEKPDVPPLSPDEVAEFVAKTRTTRPLGWSLMERLRDALRKERPPGPAWDDTAPQAYLGTAGPSSPAARAAMAVKRFRDPPEDQ
jgi:hypothetical protein